ncbi:hypothetical protein ACLB2K_023234 [Fragaria x ananassa]
MNIPEGWAEDYISISSHNLMAKFPLSNDIRFKYAQIGWSRSTLGTIPIQEDRAASPWFSLSWKFVLAVQCLGGTGQFIGHGKFEKRAPALMDNFAQALLMGPCFGHDPQQG